MHKHIHLSFSLFYGDVGIITLHFVVDVISNDLFLTYEGVSKSFRTES
jgi:hypothetical protein